MSITLNLSPEEAEHLLVVLVEEADYLRSSAGNSKLMHQEADFLSEICRRLRDEIYS